MNGVLALGPVFVSAKRQEAPCRMITDLGIIMYWGPPEKRRQARLYWNEKTTKITSFEQVVLHEEDTPESFIYQEYLAHKTKLGTFYSLTAYLRHLYRQNKVNRPIIPALIEVDQLLPIDSASTRLTGRLNTDLEIKGFHITTAMKLNSRVLLDVGWKTQKGHLSYFTGVLEVKLTTKGPTAQWVLPGQVGVNHLLMAEFNQVCPSPADCLAPEFQKEIFAGIRPIKTAKHVKSCWNNAVLMVNVGSSSTP
jgi:hypothetical protein